LTRNINEPVTLLASEYRIILLNRRCKPHRTLPSLRSESLNLTRPCREFTIKYWARVWRKFRLEGIHSRSPVAGVRRGLFGQFIIIFCRFINMKKKVKRRRKNPKNNRRHGIEPLLQQHLYYILLSAAAKNVANFNRHRAVQRHINQYLSLEREVKSRFKISQ
jgi:hypothetical protein